MIRESEDRQCFALLPLDEDLLDFLIERSPRFRRDCEQIRVAMQAGQFHSHEEVKKLLANN